MHTSDSADRDPLRSVAGRGGSMVERRGGREEEGVADLCEWSGGQGSYTSDSSLCPALFSLSHSPVPTAATGDTAAAHEPLLTDFDNTSKSVSGGVNLTRVERLAYCEGEAGVGGILYRVPAQRRQSLVVVQSLDGLWRQAAFEPVSHACGTCVACLGGDDEPPTCALSGCAGCPITGALYISARMLPPHVTAGAEFEVLLVCAMSDGVGGGFTQTAATLRTVGRRDACGVCGGDNSSCTDCFGVPHGTAIRDSCGTCGGADESCDEFVPSLTVTVLTDTPPAAGPAALEGQVAGEQLYHIPHVCAGDSITVAWRAPNGAEARDRLVIFFPARFGRLPAAADQLLFPPGSSPSASEGIFAGTLSFQTAREWWDAGAGAGVAPGGDAGNLIHFEYFTHGPADHGAYEEHQAAAISSAIALAPPADVCGVCGGNGSSCLGCDGEVNSNLIVDECGVCGGQNECVDCRGVPHGGFRLDLCGQCALPVLVCLSGPHVGTPCSATSDCNSDILDQNVDVGHAAGREEDAQGCGASWLRVGEWNACVDCAGVVNGSATRDSCGVCGGVDDSCARPFMVELAVTEMCLQHPLTAIWTGPTNRDLSTYIGIVRVTSDGSSGPILGWAPVEPSGNRLIVTQPGGSGAGGVQEVLGESVYQPPGDVGSGYVVFNRGTLMQQPDSCQPEEGGGWASGERGGGGGGGERDACLSGTQYLRPSVAGTYRFQLVDSAVSSHVSAQSQPFTVLPAAACGCDGVPHSGLVEDICGVCGGDESLCTGNFSKKIIAVRYVEISCQSGVRE